jgi:hypothetical protein
LLLLVLHEDRLPLLKFDRNLLADSRQPLGLAFVL